MRRWLLTFALPAAVLLSQLAVALYIAEFSYFLPDEKAKCFAILFPTPTAYLVFVVLRARSIETGNIGVPWARMAIAVLLALVGVLLVRAKDGNEILTRPESFRHLFALLYIATAAFLGFTLALPFMSTRRPLARTAADASSTAPIDCEPQSLSDLLTDSFNRDECWLLLRRLNVNPEFIKGASDGTQPLFASEIVDYFRRRDALQTLCEAVRASRNRSI